MTESADSRLRRCYAALQPFVEHYRLALNPEDLELMAVAVVQHIDTPSEPAEIARSVRALLDSEG